MNKKELLKRYVDVYNNKLKTNTRILSILKEKGIKELFIIENFNLGYVDGTLINTIGDNKELIQNFKEIGLIKNNKEVFKNHLLIPVFDDNKSISNIAFHSLSSKDGKVKTLNDNGIFNKSFLKNNKEIIFTNSPIDTFILMQNNIANSTFIFGENDRYIRFFEENQLSKAYFTMDGHATLSYQLTSSGISVKRIITDFDKFNSDSFNNLITDNNTNNTSSDIITEIENGFLFRFPHLNYRVIGNFNDFTLVMKANIKVFKENDLFVNSIDMYKNRERNSFICDIMDKFHFRNQLQLESDINKIIEVIEAHREKKEKEKKKVKPELTEHQKTIGMKFLKNPDLVNEIAKDIDTLGYVREDKNKILMYLIMTSRLLSDPIHAMVISRSGAGKSFLVELVEKCTPPEELESVSDLSEQALYYYEQDALKHKFVVIGEKEGSKGSDYPLRELMSKKYIKKSVPIKDGETAVECTFQ